VRNLSEALLMEPATLSPMLKRMESADLVSRNRAPDNDRSLAVDLTEHGRALRQKALAVPGAMMERLQLSREEVLELNASMRRLIEATQGSLEPNNAN
jgi:DNA-binding MarR family transcriptional regulator